MIKGYSQKPSKKQNPKDNYLKLKVALPSDISDSVVNEIFDVLGRTPFNKISVPVSTYRYYTDSSVGEDDNRVITIGYVKSFNAEEQVFSVVIFNNNKHVVEQFKNPALEVIFSEYSGKLGTITKLNIIDIADVDNTDDAAVNEEDTSAEAPAEQ